jgi:hypothetical protein
MYTHARATLRIGLLIMVLLVGGVVVGGLAVGGLFILIKAPPEIGIRVLGLSLFTSSLILGYPVSRTNLWVEIEGRTIRERRLFTGWIVERPISEVTEVVPLVSGDGGITGAASDGILKTPNRGFLIQFQEGRRVVLIRGDVRGLDEFMAVLRYDLGRRWSEVLSPCE